MLKEEQCIQDMATEQMHIACGQNNIYIVQYLENVVSLEKVCQKSILTHLYIL